jgi:hypothetical protein
MKVVCADLNLINKLTYHFDMLIYYVWPINYDLIYYIKKHLLN